MQYFLNGLVSIDAVVVSRSYPDNQNEFSWTIEFTSDLNSGNLDDLILHCNDEEGS